MAEGTANQAQYQMKCAFGSGRARASVVGGGHYVKTIYTLIVISIYIIFNSIPLMVVIIPPSAYAAANANPTRADIDAYIGVAGMATLRGIVREIECKSGAGALLHPAEEYFVEQCSSLL